MSDNNFTWFENYRRRRAAKRYARRLPPRLAKDNGRSEFYTKAQIDTAIKNLGLESKYLAIAYGGCLPKEEFEGWVHAMPIPMSYVEARTRYLRHKPIKLRSRTGTPGPMRSGGWSGGWSGR